MRATASSGPGNLTAPVGAFALVFITALGLSLIATPLSIRLGRRFNLLAVPGGRRKHSDAIPRSGGIAVYIAFVGAVLVSQLLIVNPDAAIQYPAFQVPRFDSKETIRLTGLLLGGTLIFIVGLIDDWKELPPLPQYVAQIIAASLAVAFLILIEFVNNPLTGQQTQTFAYPLTVTVTIFWLGLMMNTVNWLDGVDGLASGVAAIACIVLFLNAAFRLDPPQDSVALLPIALLGAVLGFLPFNFSPAKIFLGSGAYFLGFVLGVFSIIGGAKMASILLVMGLPLLDLGWQIVRRLSRGQNPARGDRGHLHFRLLDLGLSQRQIVIGYYLFSSVFGGLALMIPSRLYKFVALIVMIGISLAGFVWLSRQGPNEKSSDTPIPGSADG